MRCLKDCHARRFVNSARLHSYETILDQINSANPVLAAKLIQSFEHRNRVKLPAVDCDRLATLEAYLNVLGFGARTLRRFRQTKNICRRLCPRVFEYAA